MNDNDARLAHARGTGACRLNGCPCGEYGYTSQENFGEQAPLASAPPTYRWSDRTMAGLDLVVAVGGGIALLLVGIAIGRML